MQLSEHILIQLFNEKIEDKLWLYIMRPFVEMLNLKFWC